ncbi:MAG: FHA domain-containing protein [Gemmatimonadetes bacterium]|nr:FHA domain-containing protein [Gemmatimonadota bacterium]
MSFEVRIEVEGRDGVRSFQDTVRVGRTPQNDIVIDEATVSGSHLEVRRVGEGWVLVDLDSTNGTFVDGEKITTLPLGHRTRVRLGPGGAARLQLTVPALAPAAGATRIIPAAAVVDRVLGDAEPEDMSERTRVLRARIQEQRAEVTRDWSGRTRRLKVGAGVLGIVAVIAASYGVWQGSRVQAQREAAAGLFYTLKEIELDLRRLEAVAGVDDETRERQARLESQYDDLMATLGIYSPGTPPEVQLIYRTIHRLGESEVTVPREFIDEVLRYVDGWNEADLRAGFDRARAAGLGPAVGEILLDHHLPREFFYLALQESKLDADAIGPSTRFGIPKGMWQMIPGTAEAYGLTLGPLQGERRADPADERHDVAKATAAAARYLADIYETDAQASGLLVMAAYNLGEPRLLRLVRSMPESPRERNFWVLMNRHRDAVPDETYDYVYRIVSAAVIGSDPALFGFDLESPLGPLADPLGDDVTP